MVILVLLLCLESNPDRCTEHRPVIEPLSPFACAIQGQIIAADYLNKNPGWQLRRWRCLPDKVTRL